ncbi:MAG: hypothetical protein R3F07_17525 [Opitutaceae bacterium]
MSLINDALKKAQSVQGPPPGIAQNRFSGPPGGTPGAISQPDGGGHATIARRGNPMSAQKLVLILLVAGVVFIGFIGAMGVGAYIIIKEKQPAEMAQAPAPVVDAAEVIAIPEPEPVAVVEAKPEPKPDPLPALPPPIRVNRPDPDVLAYVNTLNVRGIRISDGESKVLMNNKVYKTGEIVNYDLNLKLSEVSGKELIFEDVQGNTYIARF